MNPIQFQRVKALFDTLADLPEEQRSRFLDQHESLGETTLRQLHDLLDADAAVAGMTARTALTAAARSGMEQGDWSGRRVGAYVIERALGSGGMGSVFLARRADGSVEQSVAIKIVRPDLLDENTLARFRLERQVLALLRHPNIAAMLDLGELDDGSPYVVMEYIDGVPITHYAQLNKLDMRQRLRLFGEVCDAVAYAHRNLVVHRDLKPSNVLVGADGRPRLLDFGIAKPLLGQLGTIDVEETGAAQRFFSPHNAAPEQLRGESIGVACDVYGLGALLYELLAGVPPLSLQGKTAGEMENSILHEDPLPPSARVLSESPLAGDIDQVVEAPTATLRQRSTALRGDLDCIVLRCLRKHADERYESVTALADDIARHLSGFPVLARRGSRLYRIQRFIKRNRVALTAAFAIAAVSGLALFAVLGQRQSTIQQRARADQMTSIMQRALFSADPDQMLGKDVTAREVFERVATQTEHDVDLNSASRSTLLAAIAEITSHIGEPKEALRLLDEVDMTALDRESRDSAMQSRARIQALLGDTAAAAKALAEGRAGAPTELANAQWLLIEATLLYQQGKLAEAQPLLVKLTDPGIPESVRDGARILLASVYTVLGHPESGYDLYKQLLSEQRARLPAEHPALIQTLGGLAHLAEALGRTEEVEALTSEALRIGTRLYGEHSLGYLQVLRTRRNAIWQAGRFADAVKIQNEILKLTGELLGAEHPKIASESLNMADLTHELRDNANASTHYRRAIEVGERAWRPTDMNLMIFRTALGGHLVGTGEYAEAERVIDVALHNAEIDASLKQYDVFAVALLVKKIAVYAATPSPQNREALIASAQYAQKEASSESSQTATKELVDAARRLGVSLNP